MRQPLPSPQQRSAFETWARQGAHNTIPGHVWVVSRFECGYGGDDDRRIIAVCRTAEKAYEIADTTDDVMAYPLDETVA